MLMFDQLAERSIQVVDWSRAILRIGLRGWKAHRSPPLSALMRRLIYALLWPRQRPLRAVWPGRTVRRSTSR